MSEIRIDYIGQLKCSAMHLPSGKTIETEGVTDGDAPVGGFSPSDLLAAALGASMETSIAEVAAQKGINLEGLRVVVLPWMSEQLPRRVEKLEVQVFLPIPEDHSDRKILQIAALGCPIRHSLHAEVEVPVKWIWNHFSESASGEAAPLNQAEVSSDDLDTSWLDRLKDFGG